MARTKRGTALCSLHHVIDLDWMLEAYRLTRKDGAPGIDGVTAADYDVNLEANLLDLLERIKSGRYRAPPVKAASTDFVVMRQLAMRLRGLLRGGTAAKLDIWLSDARKSDIHGMRRFARTVKQDLEAVRNAVLEPWSNGQTEGQINRLKMLKRTMYGRAGVDLLRARMPPLPDIA